jgi:hypothetical protein
MPPAHPEELNLAEVGESEVRLAARLLGPGGGTGLIGRQDRDRNHQSPEQKRRGQNGR